MPRAAAILTLAGAFLGAVAPAAAPAQERDHASWWIASYGLVDPANEPLARRAEIIFERLAAAADKRANRLPRLAILNAEGQPFAMALPDGTILLTRGALRICYREVPEASGDARLAFVIGHELSHLGNDDFWHAAAFDAVKAHGVAERTFDAIRSLFEGSADDAKRRELQADAYGMLYMTTAGYEPLALLQNESFWEEWASELDGLGVRTADTHPAPVERGAFIRTQLAAIADGLDYFHFGVRLVQLGRFQDGLLLLERFRDSFPSREVLNNIGVAHYQLAARFLGNCDGRLVVRFKLPTLLDPTTRAVRLRSGEMSSPCFSANRFQLHFREAERNLAAAAQMDPDYSTARLNLLSLYALAAQGAQALAASEEVKALLPDDPRVQSGAAVALYLYGEQSGVEMADTAIAQLQAIHKTHPRAKEAVYNLAAMLAERRRVQAAEETYRAYLELEPRGLFADAARDYLGTFEKTDERTGAATASFPAPPVPLGPLNRRELDRRVESLSVEGFVIGDFNGSFVRFDGGRALVIDDTIELIEIELESPRRWLAERHGAPAREHPLGHGRLVFYDGVALEIVDGAVVKRLYF